MLTDVESVSFKELEKFRSDTRREGVRLRDCKGAMWYCIRSDGEIVSFYCLAVATASATFRCNYTVPAFRRQGCLRRFINHAKRKCLELGISNMTVFCSPMSYKSHLREGAEIVRTRGDIRIMKYTSALRWGYQGEIQ